MSRSCTACTTYYVSVIPLRMLRVCQTPVAWCVQSAQENENMHVGGTKATIIDSFVLRHTPYHLGHQGAKYAVQSECSQGDTSAAHCPVSGHPFTEIHLMPPSGHWNCAARPAHQWRSVHLEQENGGVSLGAGMIKTMARACWNS